MRHVRLAYALIGTIVCGSQGATAQGPDGDDFRVGGSCAALAYLSPAQIKHYTSNAFSEEFHAFCYPEEPFDCTDYTSFLKGAGSMTTSEDGHYCRLKLAD